MTTGSQSAPRGAARLFTPIALAIVATLGVLYIVSQFLRNSVGVIAPDLAAELGLSAAEIGTLSSAFFLAFAAVQLPLGIALDRFGPRRCLVVCTGIAIVGAILFASATSPGGLIVARALLGVGASASLVAPLSVYAWRFPPERFATLAGLQIGLGTIGTLIATAPLAFSTAAIGWRGSFLGVAAVTAVIGIAVAVTVKDDGAVPHGQRETLGESVSGLLEVLRTPSIGRVFIMSMVVYSSFTLIVGLWGGPYLTHVYGYDLEQRGSFLLIPVLAQIIGSLLWGPMDRLTGSHKLPVLVGAGATTAALAYLAIVGTVTPPAALVAWFAAFGFLCAFGVVLIGHGKALFPLHLVGRALTVLNIGSMGGVFLMQIVSGFVIGLFPTAPDGAYALDAYRLVFGLQAAFILLGSLVYLGARDPAPGSAKGSPAPIA